MYADIPWFYFGGSRDFTLNNVGTRACTAGYIWSAFLDGTRLKDCSPLVVECIHAGNRGFHSRCRRRYKRNEAVRPVDLNLQKLSHSKYCQVLSRWSSVDMMSADASAHYNEDLCVEF